MTDEVPAYVETSDPKPALPSIPVEAYADLREEIVGVMVASSLHAAVGDLIQDVLRHVDWAKVDNDLLQAVRTQIDGRLHANVK